MHQISFDSCRNSDRTGASSGVLEQPRERRVFPGVGVEEVSGGRG